MSNELIISLKPKNKFGTEIMLDDDLTWGSKHAEKICTLHRKVLMNKTYNL
jgi:hypothetical protein